MERTKTKSGDNNGRRGGCITKEVTNRGRGSRRRGELSENDRVLMGKHDWAIV